MRGAPSILHVDMDAFFAAVEQRDKPSLAGKPVVVGGLGPRGVVATASYEARAFGVFSAMPTGLARRRCPTAAFLAPRFAAYRATSDRVLAELGRITPLVEAVSIDEAYLDLTPADVDTSVAGVTVVAEQLRRRIAEVTGGLTASVGAATSKAIAKIASDRCKPNGLLVVPPGEERELLDPLPVRVLPGVGPATSKKLAGIGVHLVGDLARLSEPELVALLGSAHGRALAALARGVDDRPVVPEREVKSISVEETFAHDLPDGPELVAELELLAHRLARRLAEAKASGRTVTLKVRTADFVTVTRSMTLESPTASLRRISSVARQLLPAVDLSPGVRLLGVGVSGLDEWTQEDLFPGSAAGGRHDADPGESRSADPAEPSSAGSPESRADPAAPSSAASPESRTPEPAVPSPPSHDWRPGQDVRHDTYGAGWVWGSGLGRVTVRFEGPGTLPGPVRTFADDDPGLAPADPPLPWAG